MVCGPIFGDKQELMKASIEVPDAFYKVILDVDGSTVRALAFIMPETVTGKESLETFLVSVDRVETLSGLDFFGEIKDTAEDALESATASRLW